MAQQSSTIGKLLQQLTIAVNAHDRENPSHNTWGIGMAGFDIERLGLEEGEQILPGIVLQADSGVSGAFRILCDGDHGAGREEAEEESVDAVAEEAQEREIAIPAQGGQAEPIRPPF